MLHNLVFLEGKRKITEAKAREESKFEKLNAIQKNVRIESENKKFTVNWPEPALVNYVVHMGLLVLLLRRHYTKVRLSSRQRRSVLTIIILLPIRRFA